jgi:hypothetical protein
VLPPCLQLLSTKDQAAISYLLDMFEVSRAEAIVAEHLYRQIQDKADGYRKRRDGVDKSFGALKEHVLACIAVADSALANFPDGEPVGQSLLTGNDLSLSQP